MLKLSKWFRRSYRGAISVKMRCGHGRQLPWWAISGSIVATETSAITFVSIPGVAYARGGDFTFLQLVFGYLIGRIVICLVFMPAYFRKNLLTIYELLRSRFGGSVRSLAAASSWVGTWLVR